MSLDKPSAYFRSNVSRAAPADVDHDGRVINGYSVCTAGEALGHGLWLDDAFLGSVADAGNAAERGIKGRFTHPELSGDGLGKVLGRTKEFRVDGGRVLGDLHLLKAASKSPSGDLAGYVMALAEEDPESFGASIVFARDMCAERAFIAEHQTDADEAASIYSGTATKTEFRSPDPKNTENLRHARLKALRASDIVDEPAANPGGFFHEGQEVAAKADVALAYCLGLSEEAPAEAAFGVSPDRARGFVARFLSQRGLQVVGPPQEPTDEEDAMASATLDELSTKYSDGNFVVAQLKAGSTLEQASAAFEAGEAARAKDAELAEANAEIERLKAAVPVQAPPVDDIDPVANFDDGTSEPATGDFMQQARAHKAEHGCTLGKAIATVARQKPELHSDFVRTQHQNTHKTLHGQREA